MTPPRLRVEIGAEPYVLGSAIHAYLERDPRLDVVLAGPPGQLESGVPVCDLVSDPAVVHHARVTGVTDDPPRFELLVDGDSRSIPYDGMAALADALVQAVRGWTNTPEEQHA